MPVVHHALHHAVDVAVADVVEVEGARWRLPAHLLYWRGCHAVNPLRIMHSPHAFRTAGGPELRSWQATMVRSGFTFRQ